MVDSLLSDLGIEGGNLSKMGGLIREARDIQSIARGSEKGKDGEGGPGGGDDTGSGSDGDTPSGSKS